MKLTHIALTDLKPSDLNVRKSGLGNLDDLIASIRALGVIQPLLVRQAHNGFEVIAGQRRLAALKKLAEEGEAEPVPCAILEDGDDALAIEASLAENIQRLPMTELDQYAAFAALRAKERTVEDIAAHFGVTERLVKQRLAIANLDHRILGLYEDEAVTSDTMRALTLATKGQQKAWLKRFRDPADHAPIGRQLRLWLLGGAQISTSAALFDVADYKGVIVTDLFGEDSYFADATAFWSLQNAEIAAKSEAYIAAGWSDVVVLDPANHWPEYEYRKASKKKGGRVYVAVTHSGEVEFHEGYLPEKELRAKEASEKASQEAASAPKLKAEFTKAASNYCNLHKHAAVQDALVSHTGISLRLSVAHMIGRSHLWSIRTESGRADKPETKASVEKSSSRKAFETSKAEAMDLLGIDEEERPEHVVDQSWQGKSVDEIFAKLCEMPDSDVLKLMAVAMAETLEAGTALVDVLGVMMNINMSERWSADDAFLDLITSKATLLSMLKDIAGPDTADAHKDSKAKVIRSVIRQFALGDGREKVDGWVPSLMHFKADDGQEDDQQQQQQADDHEDGDHDHDHDDDEQQQDQQAA
ncbi:ParB/RepB/Spo0J family partition protein [Roseovarius sp.]|uniref:ParB/RepB/Spo0J family partition protein n=1 Tax=Roseovarius sp. TaxID=1486281 RepID=UPI003A96DF85